MNIKLSGSLIALFRDSQVAAIPLFAALSGLLVATLDINQAAQSFQSTGHIGMLLLYIAVPLILTALGLALLCFGVTHAAVAIQRRFLPNRQWVAPVLFCIVSSPGALFITGRLFHGGFTSRLPATELLMALTFLCLLGGTFLLVEIIGLLRRWTEKQVPKNTWRPIAVAIILFVVSFGLRWCDANLYRRLYSYLHVVLSLATLGSALLATYFLFLNSRHIKRLSVAGGIALVGTVIATAYMAFSPEPTQTIRMAIDEDTATLADLLPLLPSRSPSATQWHHPSEQTAPFPLRRNSNNALPTFPGAHLIIISVDALRADRLGIYGFNKRNLSPSIDEFANNATVFEHAYCAAPHSSFAITSFHISRNTHVESTLEQKMTYPTIADMLNKKGYQTVAFYTEGIFYTEAEHVAHYQHNKFGFSTVHHPGSNPTKMTDQVIETVDQNIQEGEPPLFLWAHYFNVHEPYQSTRYGHTPLDRYEGEIREVDNSIGRLLHYLDATLTKDVVLVFTADHGEEFKDHGGFYHGSSLYEEQVRVPFLLRIPHTDTQRIKQAVSMIDMAPTVLELLGAPVPLSMLGRDLRPAIVKGEDALAPAPIFGSVMNQHMAIEWPWKLIATPSRNLYKLFQLESDPRETTNIFDSRPKKGQQLLNKLQNQLSRIAATENPAQMALNLGRMRDRRAIKPLVSLAEDPTANDTDRQSALQLLAKLRPWNETARLVTLLDDSRPGISIHAALALAEVNKSDGKEQLATCLHSKDNQLKHRCILAMAKLGEKNIIPQLIDVASNAEITQRKTAIRFLADFQDPQAVAPLIEILTNLRTRSMTALALGMIGDPIAGPRLLQLLAEEKFTNIRESIVIALGLLKTTAAGPMLRDVLVQEPEIRWTPEALLRIGAVEDGLIAGVDVSAESTLRNSAFSDCKEASKPELKRFLDSSYCTTLGGDATLKFSSRQLNVEKIYLRIRSNKSDTSHAIEATIKIDNRVISTIRIGSKWKEHVLSPTDISLNAGTHTVSVELAQNRSFEWDHFIIVPSANK